MSISVLVTILKHFSQKLNYSWKLKRKPSYIHNLKDPKALEYGVHGNEIRRLSELFRTTLILKASTVLHCQKLSIKKFHEI